jgi:hypothetical protein
MDELVGSNVACWYGLMCFNEAAWGNTRAVPSPRETAKAALTLRQVEGRVRSFVHSALKALRKLVARGERLMVRFHLAPSVRIRG